MLNGKLKPTFALAGAVPRRVASSYGLMQILYVTACDLGFTGEPEMLFVPRVGLEWGALQLAKLLAWAGGDIERALCAYNGGTGIADGPGPYKNAFYASRVMAARDELLKA
jgi:soluble lytic murein transglycosylase-like protein